MNHLYSPDDYDRYLALKVPFLLMATMLYAIRHMLIVFLAYNPNPKLGSAFAFMQHMAQPWFVAADLPAILVVMAWSQRNPKAKQIWRTIWRYGRILLTGSLLLQFVLLSYTEGFNLIDSYIILNRDRFVLISLVINLLAIYYLWRSPRVSDVFADFPQPSAVLSSPGRT